LGKKHQKNVRNISKDQSKMKIAIIGIRGIPFIYSGFEVFAEKFAVDFARKGHNITVYCRNNYFKNKVNKYKGVRLIYLPTIRTKYSETFIHSLFSTAHACLFGNYDLIYFLGVSNAPFTLLPRLFRIKTLINIDGLDWKREKWNFIGKFFLKSCEFLVSLVLSTIITDSIYIKNYYFKKYGKVIEYFPYGFFKLSTNKGINSLKKFGLTKNQYLVWVGRFVPDNHLEEIIIAFKKIKTNYKLVIIGDDLYKSEYKKYILDLIDNNPKIILTGFISHQECVYLMKNSFAYVETKRSGGTHPSLIDAMGSGCLIISSNHQTNKSIIKNDGFYYNLKDPVQSLKNTLETIIHSADYDKIRKIKSNLKKRAEIQYSWKKIINSYEEFLFNLMKPH